MNTLAIDTFLLDVPKADITLMKKLAKKWAGQ